MDETPLYIYIGLGVGVTAALAYGLYKYFTRNKKDNGSQIKSEETEYQEVDILNYETLLKWLREQSRLGIACPGDSFMIFQNNAAAPMFVEVYPNKESLIEGHRCLSVAVVHDEKVKTAKFYLYSELTSSLSDMLPEDEDTAYIQKLS